MWQEVDILISVLEALSVKSLWNTRSKCSAGHLLFNFIVKKRALDKDTEILSFGCIICSKSLNVDDIFWMKHAERRPKSKGRVQEK